MAEPLFDPEIYRTFFGVEDEEEIQYVEDMLEAIGNIDRALVPRGNTHPYMAQIRQGKEGIDFLLAELDNPAEGTTPGDVFDALGFIFINMPAPPKALQVIRGWLSHKTFGEIAARTLAIGQDQAFLNDVVNDLASDDPGVVAAAAMLMGYGRFTPATELLVNLVSPLRFIESRAILWALGEIGAQEAIPVITRCLAESFRPIDAMIALGKIGNLATANMLIPYIVQGDRESREIALRSLSMIMAKNEDVPEAVNALNEIFRDLLIKMSQEDDSKTARFYALLCLGRMGQKMRPDQVRNALGMSLREDEMSSFQNFFVRKKK